MIKMRFLTIYMFSALRELVTFQMTFTITLEITETRPGAIRSACARRLEGPACTSTAYMTALGERMERIRSAQDRVGCAPRKETQQHPQERSSAPACGTGLAGVA